MTPRRGRALTEADRRLWADFLRGVTPLPGRARFAEPEPREALAPPPAPVLSAPREKPGPARPAAPPLAPFDPALRRKLRRGVQRAEAAIDLHGLRQEEAHALLSGFLARAQAAGHGLVLVVTGKGAAGLATGGEERGVLRRQVPHWLRLPALRPLVLGFEEAPPHRGGAGALYVRLRRSRTREP